MSTGTPAASALGPAANAFVLPIAIVVGATAHLASAPALTFAERLGIGFAFAASQLGAAWLAKTRIDEAASCGEGAPLGWLSARVGLLAFAPALALPIVGGVLGVEGLLSGSFLRSLTVVACVGALWTAAVTHARVGHALDGVSLDGTALPAALRVSLTTQLRVALSIAGLTGLLLALEVAQAGQAGGFALGLRIAGAGALLWLFAAELMGPFGRRFEAIRQRAESLAAGVLPESTASAAQDECGATDRALQAIATAQRELKEEGREVADRAVEAGLRFRVLLEGLEAAREARASRTSEARTEIARIANQVSAVQNASVDLTRAIEESSASVLQLGAGGDELNETASVLSSRVDAVSVSIEQMVQSVKAVGSTTDRLAAASEETSSSMEEMASAMRAVDNAAETTAGLSRNVVHKAEIGQDRVAQTIAGMEAIQEATEAAESVIRGLGARTSEIGGILDVIDDVADETNLLALNAAIIAAQAGEQGKAFSVVADEIKELADRVLASTKEIGGLIRSVQDESENAIGAIEAGAASVKGGVELSVDAGRTLEEITDASRESGTRISEIVNSVREQTKAASHVVGLMEKVRESAEQIGEASDDQDRGNEVVYRSAQTMREVAQQVRRTAEEQATGFGRIRENVVGVRNAVEEITESLGHQATASQQVAAALEGVEALGHAHEGAIEGAQDAMEALLERADALAERTNRVEA